MIKAVVNDSFYSLINKICYFLFKTLTILLVINFSPKEYMVIFVLCVSTSEILRIIVDFGVDTYSVRNFARSTIEDKVKYANIVFRQKIIFGFFASVISSLILYCIYRNAVVFVVLGAVPFSLLFNLPISFFQAISDSRKITGRVVVASVISGSFVMISYLFFKGDNVTLFLYIINEIIFSILAVSVLFKYKILKWSFNFSFYDLFKLYKGTLYIGLTATLVIFYSRADTFILGYLHNSNMGLYASIFRIVDPFVMVFSVFSTVLYANLSRKSISRGYLAIFFCCIIAVLVIAGSVYWWGVSYIIPIIIPAIKVENLLGEKLIIILMILAIIKCINGMVTALILSKGLFKVSFFSAMLCCTFSIPVIYSFTIKYNILGTGYALIVIESVSLIFLILLLTFYRKKRGDQ
ncbi:hypothetical protein C0W42_21420 [Photobacterium kishitanii]|nr:hypothetical protein C0W42_21420 [Photobacterium kishitanii]